MMKVHKLRSKIFTLVLSMLVALVPALTCLAVDPQTVDLQVQHQPDIEIALALGASSMDVSSFSDDIKAKLLNTYGISSDRVKVTAIQTNAVDAKSEFDWKTYDHYYNPAYPTDGTLPSGWPSNVPYFYYSETDPADYTSFFTDVSETDNSLAACYYRSKHIYAKNNDLYFLGYSVPAYKDFMLYPDSIVGKKTIEFTIEESQIDTHTLEGAGFLFNTGITTDGLGVERLNGYLVLYDYYNAYFDYTNNYWVGKKVNLYQLNNVDASALHQEYSYRLSDLAYNGTSGITLLASKDSQSMSETLNIKIEAKNDSFKLLENGNTIYDTMGPDSAITINDTGAYGFGPLVSYSSHWCPSLTYFTYKDITMTTETVKSFLNIIREPDWQDNTRKFIVNLDDDGVSDFQDGQKLAEILYRMINLDIDYLGWGLNNNVPEVIPDLTNEDQANSFIANNNGKGLFVNQSNVDSDSYEEGIAKIAEYINSIAQTPDSYYILLDEPYSFVFDPADLTGTWRIDHDPTVYPENAGAVSWDNQILTTFPAAFDKSGKYEVYYNDGVAEQKVIDIYAAWRPVAAVTYDPAAKTLTDESYDPNGMALTQEWKWKTVFDADWTIGQPDPTIFDETSYYIVQLRVQNTDEVWSQPCALYITNNTEALPIAAFTLPAKELNMTSGTTTIMPSNKSYHPSGSPLDEFKWEVYDSQNTMVLNYTTKTPVIDFVNLPTGTFAIELSVRAGVNWSAVFTQTLNVLAPAVIFTPDGSLKKAKTASPVVTLDGGVGNYTSSEYQWTTSADFPEGGTWTPFVSGDRITLSKVSGNYYLHIRATDLDARVHEATSNKFILTKAISGDGGGNVSVPPGLTINANSYYGTDRFETAVSISKAGWEKADTVVLVRSDDFADALAGVPLAYKLDCPILLTYTASLPDVVIAEIQRLQASKVVILGGNVAVSENVAAKAAQLGLQVERIGGIDRFATAALIATRVKPADANTSVIVNGNVFPDALAMASYAAVKGYPILMVERDFIPMNTAAALANLNIKNTIVIGLTGVVSQNIFDQLPLPIRFGGDDRYATAVEIAKHFVPGATEMFIATGLDFPDAIAGAVLAAKHNSGILYVPGNLQSAPYVDADVLQFIINNKVTTINILGGSGVINDATINSLKNPTK